MKKLLKIKTLAICAILFAGIIFPTILTAQRSDGFFKSGNEDLYENREGEINGITAPYFGDKPAPLGGGLLVLAAAGTCYAVTRRKRSLRKGTMLLLALAIVLGTTQCKKRIETVTTNSGDSILLTLKVNNGGKHHIDPSTLGTDYVPIYFDAKTNTTHGDYIYVGDGSNYIGTLECIVPSDYYGNGAVFQGTISGVNNDDVLHFYFIGGLTPSVAPTNSTTDFTIDITNQSGKLPVLSYGTGVYNDGNIISCSLDNKCALVELRFVSGTSNTVKISNMLSKVKINFANPDNPIEPLESPLDAITLYSQNSTQKWAILLPGQQRSAMGMVATTSEECGYYYYDNVTVRALSNNTYIHGDGENGAIIVDNSAANINNRVFQVSANGNAVRFAVGNLICTTSATLDGDGHYDWSSASYTWSFMNNPYERIANKDEVLGDNYCNKNIAGHFGWGCTGNKDAQYGAGQDYYFPYNTVFSNQNYGPTGVHDLSLLNGSDWGCVSSSITNGGGYQWRLLTSDEWEYLTKYRPRYLNHMARVMVNKLGGLLLLPENWECINPTPVIDVKWSDNRNQFSIDQWNTMKGYGAVFLSVGGTRYANKINGGVTSFGYYWLSTVSTADNAYYATVHIDGTSCTTNHRAEGRFVRLVR